MRFTVVWQRHAEEELTQLWLAADSTDRTRITAAAHQIESLLKLSPLKVGESRSGSARIVIVSPLVITYDVRELDRIVDVFAVHVVPTH